MDTRLVAAVRKITKSIDPDNAGAIVLTVNNLADLAELKAALQEYDAQPIERRRKLVEAPLPRDVQAAAEQAALALSAASQAHETLTSVIRQHLPRTPEN